MPIYMYRGGVAMAEKLGSTFYRKVNEETLCRCTYLTDSEGDYIFEGDIIEAERQGSKTAVVTFESGMFKAHGMSLCTWTLPHYSCKVVGNVFDEEEKP